VTKRNNNPYSESFALHGLATLYYKKEDYKKAEKSFLELAALEEKNDYKANLADTYVAIARNYIRLSQPHEAEIYLNKAKNIINTLDLPKEKMKYGEVTALLYLFNNNKEAYDALVYSIDHREEEFDEAIKSKNFELMELYKTQELEQQKLQLASDLDFSTDTVLKQKKTIYWIGGIVALLLTLISFIVYLFSRQKKLNVQLQNKNHEIELLNKEINHRVKNNLAFVSSLLEMQGRRLENEEAKKYIMDTETRIKAVAAANQQIFNTGKDSSTINLKKYLDELAWHLKSIYDTPEKPIDIQMEVDNSTIQAEDAMRIGLVMNEMMTNSIKHAFKEVSTPLITIKSSASPDGKIVFNYSDNGQKFNPLEKTAVQNNKNSMGLKIIHLLQNQLSHQYQFVVG